MRRIISCSILCALFVMPLPKASGSDLTIAGLSKMTAGPFDVVEIYGSGFGEASDMLVIFANGAYVVAIPPVWGTESALQVPVPFFFNTKSGAINSGIVSVTVKNKSLGIQSNSISGFAITGLPRSTQAPGTITLAFLDDLKTLTGYAKTQLAFLKKASKGKVNTTRANSGLSKMQTTLGGLKTALTAIKKGQAAPGAPSIKVSKASLAAADRLILGYLTQLDAVAKAPLLPGGPSGPNRASDPSEALAIPSLKQVYEKLASYTTEANFNEQKLLEFMKRNEAVVGASASAIGLAATALNLPTIATAVGGFALIYSAGLAFETTLDYMSLYMGLPSGVTQAQGFLPLAKKLFDTGLDMATFNLPSTSLPKQLFDLYSSSDDDIELAKQLVEPVMDSAPEIIPELLTITVTGSWAGSCTFDMYGPGSMTANFTESGQFFSGQMTMDGAVGSVSGTMNGYDISFTWTASLSLQGHKIDLSGFFSGGFSGDGGSISGKFTITEKVEGTTVTFTGTWILSR